MDRQPSENQPQKKKQKTDMSFGANLSSLQHPTIQDIWEPLAESGLLSTPELGRLLLLSSKSFVNHDEEMVYNMLCCNHWGQDNAEALIEATQIPPKPYFMEFGIPSFVGKAHKKAALPELQYTPKDYILILEVWNLDVDKIVHSIAIPGEDMTSFFQEGSANVTLKKPAHNILFEDAGKRFSLDEHQCLVDHNRQPVKATFGTSLKLMRKPDRKVLEIHGTILEAYEFDKDFGERDTFYIGMFNRSDSLTLPKFGGSAHFLKDYFCSYEGSHGGFEVQMDMSMQADYDKASGTFSASLNLTEILVEVMWVTNHGRTIEEFRSVFPKEELLFAHVLETVLPWDGALAQPVKQQAI